MIKTALIRLNQPVSYSSSAQLNIYTAFRPRANTALVHIGTGTDTCFIQKIYAPPHLPYFKVNICPFPLPYFASIFFAYLWSFRGPDYIVTLPRYFSFRLPHLNISTGPPSDELDKNIQRTSLRLLFSHWNGYSHVKLESGIQIPCENDKVRIEPA